jgi:hypothetical protein
MGSVVLLEDMLLEETSPVVVEGVVVEGVMVEAALVEGIVPGAAKSVLVPVGTFSGRLFGGWSFMSSKP